MSNARIGLAAGSQLLDERAADFRSHPPSPSQRLQGFGGMGGMGGDDEDFGGMGGMGGMGGEWHCCCC